MRTVDQTTIRAPVERAFEAASQVERWPEMLPHYRWVRFLQRRAGGGTVEMAAWRPFGPLRYPTWWVSRSEEHTSELQSQSNLVCRLLLEKKKKKKITNETVNNKDHDKSQISTYRR